MRRKKCPSFLRTQFGKVGTYSGTALLLLIIEKLFKRLAPFIFLAGCSAAPVSDNEPFLRELRTIQLDARLGFRYALSEKVAVPSDQTELIVIKGRAGPRDLKISSFHMESPALAKQMAQERRGQVASIYSSYIDPYFSSQQNLVDCPPKFMPKLESKNSAWGQAQIVTAYSDENDVLRACSEATAKKVVEFTFMVCGQRFIQWEKYAPIAGYSDEDREELHSFRCAK